MMQNMPVINMAATGKNIYTLRKAAGLSVRDLQNDFWICHTAGNLQVAEWDSDADHRQSGRPVGSVWRHG